MARNAPGSSISEFWDTANGIGYERNYNNEFLKVLSDVSVPLRTFRTVIHFAESLLNGVKQRERERDKEYLFNLL